MDDGSCGANLAVGKHGGIVPFHAAPDERQARLLVHLRLSAVLPEDKVERKAAVLANDDLPLRSVDAQAGCLVFHFLLGDKRADANGHPYIFHGRRLLWHGQCQWRQGTRQKSTRQKISNAIRAQTWNVPWENDLLPACFFYEYRYNYTTRSGRR